MENENKKDKIIIDIIKTLMNEIEDYDLVLQEVDKIVRLKRRMDGPKKYKVTISNEEKIDCGEFRTLKECADYAKVTEASIYRILMGTNKYKKENSKHLLNIKMEKIKS